MKLFEFRPVIVQRGFSLVELMVALVIGIVSTLALMQVGVTFEDQRKTTMGSGDMVDASAVALTTLRSNLQLAGFGLNAPAVIGCNLTIFRESDGSTVNMPLTPLDIVQEGANDVISVRSADFRRYADSRFADHTGNGNPFVLDRIYGFNVGDVFLVAHENEALALPCNFGEVTGVVSDPINPSGSIEHRNGAGGRYNAAGGNGVAYLDLGSGKGIMYNLGPQPVFTQFRVANGRLQRLDILSGVTTDILDDVVSFQAQYGFRDAAGKLVWSNTVIDADGKGTVGDDGDWYSLIAARVAVVIRHGKMEKPNEETGQCDASKPTETWSFGSLDVSALPDGRCYRYRIIETVVPMRNLMWGQEKKS